MKQSLRQVMIFAMLLVSVIGVRAAGKIEVVATNGTVTTAVSANKCTLTVKPDQGYYITRNDIIVTVKIDATHADSRRRTLGIGISEKLSLEGDDPSNLSDERVYTFTMPNEAYDYKVVATFLETMIEVNGVETTTTEGDAPQATLEINISDDNTVKQEECIIVDPETGVETTKKITVVEVKLDNVTITEPSGGDGEAKKEVSLSIPPSIISADGSTMYRITSISSGFLSHVDSAVTITEIVLPTSEKPLEIAPDAFKMDDLPPSDPNHQVLTVVTPMDLLAAYALDNSLHENYEAGKVKAIVTAPNRFWTFSCGVDVFVPKGISVYTCMIDKSDEVQIVPLKDEDLVDKGLCIIKANNGVLIESADGTGNNTYEIVAAPGILVSGSALSTNDAKSYGEDNLLEPVLISKNYNSEDYYVLKDNKFHPILPNSSKMPVCKAILKKPVK